MKVTVEIRNDCDSHWAPDKKLCTKWMRATFKVINHNQDSSISVSLVAEPTAAALNAEYRGKNAATNILSFPSEYPTHLSQVITYLPLGDIVICPAIVEREATAQGKTLQSHWAHLFIHGTLHLLGYDHQEAAAANAMEQLEIKALQTLGISNPYLIGCEEATRGRTEPNHDR